MAAKILVRAKERGLTITWPDSSSVYEYERGEYGLLDWRGDPIRMAFWEPLVTWDGDGSRILRRVLFNDLEIVGLEEANGFRIISTRGDSP